MSKCSLKYRIAITIFLLEVVMMAAVLRVTISYIGDEIKSEYNQKRNVIEHLLVDMAEVALLTDGFLEFQGRVNVIVQEPNVDLVLLADHSGRVMVSSDPTHIGQNFADMVVQAQRVQIPIKIGQQIAGQLEVQFNPKLLEEKLSDAQVLGAIIALVGMLVIAFASMVMGYLLTKRLQTMIQAANEVSQGSLTARVPSTGDDELGRLGHVFNSMVGKLRAQVDELSEHRQYLQDSNKALIGEVELKQSAEESLRREKEKVQVTLEAIGDGVITTDLEGHVDYANPVATSLLHMSYKDMIGQHLDDVYHRTELETHKPLSSLVKNCLEKGTLLTSSGDVLLDLANGDTLVVQESAAPIKDYHGQVIGCVVVFRDMTQARLMEDEISYQATHDDLTGLINRREFEVRLAHLLKVNQKLDIDAAVLYLDLDQFKIVNDTFGHVAGDELLQVLSTVLRGNIGDKDSLARLGGDEFGIILIEKDQDAAMAVADKLREAVKGFRFVWDDQFFTVGVSIGVIPLTPALPHVNAVLGAADSACYVAKELGRNRIHLYSADDEQLVQHQEEMQWVSRIASAFEQNRFLLVFQPIHSMKDPDHGYHFEVLMRLHDENSTIVKPDDFLPAAERFTLMPTLDRWVVRQTFKWLNQNPNFIEGLHTCGINLSGNSLGDEYFLEFLLDQFEKLDIPKHKICFEVTETAAILNLENALFLMTRLKELGCRFALDDFGSGLSSFAYLKKLPVDYLKIDGAFVKDIMDDPIDAAMVRSIHEIGHILQKETVAEYVESEEIKAMIKDIGVDFIQGYAVSKYLPLNQFADYYQIPAIENT